MYIAVHIKVTMHDMGIYDADVGVYCVSMQSVDVPRVKNNKIGLLQRKKYLMPI
jgi:hypothetical protein